VTISVEQYRSQQILVTGEVRQPGTYPLTRRSTLLEGLARAGSTTDRAGSEVVILRNATMRSDDPASASTVIRVNLAKLESGVLEENVELRGGDTVLVTRAETVFVFG